MDGGNGKIETTRACDLVARYYGNLKLCNTLLVPIPIWLEILLLFSLGILVVSYYGIDLSLKNLKNPLNRLPLLLK